MRASRDPSLSLPRRRRTLKRAEIAKHLAVIDGEDDIGVGAKVAVTQHLQNVADLIVDLLDMGTVLSLSPEEKEPELKMKRRMHHKKDATGWDEGRRVSGTGLRAGKRQTANVRREKQQQWQDRQGPVAGGQGSGESKPAPEPLNRPGLQKSGARSQDKIKP